MTEKEENTRGLQKQTVEKRPSTLGGYVAIIRPINCSMIGLAVVVGAFVSRPSTIDAGQLLLGFVTGFAICAFSMVINDYYDVEVDRVNQPERPIPSGVVSPRSAVAFALVMLAIGLTTSVLSLNASAVGIASLYGILSWLYNYRVKAYGLAGNAIVASSLAIPFIYGGDVVGGSVTRSLLLFMAGTSFLSGVGREVVKAMADTAGDEKRGIRSFARTHGVRAASILGALFFLAAVVSSLLPLVLFPVSRFYEYGVVVPDVIFVYLAWLVISRPSRDGALVVKRRALLGMLVGLIVFVGGAF